MRETVVCTKKAYQLIMATVENSPQKEMLQVNFDEVSQMDGYPESFCQFTKIHLAQ